MRAGALLETPLEPLWLPSPAEVWALLAGAYPLEQVIMAGDFLISGRDRWAEPLCSIEELTATARRFSGCSGSAKLVAALPRLRTGVESPAESLTRLLIENAGLPTPQTCCSVPVDGRVLYADLGYPEWRIAIEYDGVYHQQGGVEQRRLDNSRREAMIDAGWRVLTLTALDLRDPSAFLRRLGKAIAAARAVRGV